MAPFRTLSCEFPNDNPALHAGASWVCLQPTGAPRAVMRAQVPEGIERPPTLTVPPVAELSTPSGGERGEASDEPRAALELGAVTVPPDPGIAGASRASSSRGHSSAHLLVGAWHSSGVGGEARALPALLVEPEAPAATDPDAERVAPEPPPMAVGPTVRERPPAPAPPSLPNVLVKSEQVAAPVTRKRDLSELLEQLLGEAEETEAERAQARQGGDLFEAASPVQAASPRFDDVDDPLCKAAPSDFVAPRGRDVRTVTTSVEDHERIGEARDFATMESLGPEPARAVAKTATRVAARPTADETASHAKRPAPPAVSLVTSAQESGLELALFASGNDAASSCADGFDAFLDAVVDEALEQGATRAAALLPELLNDQAVSAKGVTKHVVGLLAAAQIATLKRERLHPTPEFMALMASWRSALRGEKGGTAFASEETLDELAARVVSALTGAPELRAETQRRLRRRGIAAFGMVERAA